VAGGLIYAGALLGMWIVLAGQPDIQDLVVGSVAGVLAVGTGYLVSDRGKMVPSARVADLRTLAGVPWQVVAETGQVFALAARKAVGRPVAPGALCSVPVDVGMVAVNNVLLHTGKVLMFSGSFAASLKISNPFAMHGNKGKYKKLCSAIRVSRSRWPLASSASAIS
jgi:hypothetical protein